MRVKPCSFAAEPTSASYTDPPAISPSESRLTKAWAPIGERNLLSGKLAESSRETTIGDRRAGGGNLVSTEKVSNTA